MQGKFKQADRAIERLTASHEKELLRAYRDSLQELRLKISTLYEKHSKDGILTLAEANRYNRLKNLEEDITGIITRLTGSEVRITSKAINNAYREQYYHTAYILEKEISAKLGFGLLNEKTIERAVQNPLDRIGWGDRAKENAVLLNRQVREQLTRGLIQGKAYPEVAKTITERMNVGATKAARIVRTECHRVQTQGRLDSFSKAESAGLVTRRRWVATLDDRTRDSHQDMDGEYADDDGMFTLPTGITAEGPGMTGDPEEDINCRCTVIVEIEGYGARDRIARKEGGDNEIIGYKTYKEWREGRIGK